MPMTKAKAPRTTRTVNATAAEVDRLVTTRALSVAEATTSATGWRTSRGSMSGRNAASAASCAARLQLASRRRGDSASFVMCRTIFRRANAPVTRDVPGAHYPEMTKTSRDCLPQTTMRGASQTTGRACATEARRLASATRRCEAQSRTPLLAAGSCTRVAWPWRERERDCPSATRPSLATANVQGLSLFHTRELPAVDEALMLVFGL